MHYICTGGCGGVSETPGGTCQAPDCADHGQPLKDCQCSDGSHASSMEEAPEEEA